MLERLASRALSELRRRRSVIDRYHGVGLSNPAEDPHNVLVSPARFRTQVELLQRAGFEFVTVAELGDRASGSTPAPGLAALSFDDGMAENHSIKMTEDELRDLAAHGIAPGGAPPPST